MCCFSDDLGLGTPEQESIVLQVRKCETLLITCLIYMTVLGHTSSGLQEKQSICDEPSLSQIGNANTTKFIKQMDFSPNTGM